MNKIIGKSSQMRDRKQVKRELKDIKNIIQVKYSFITIVPVKVAMEIALLGNLILTIEGLGAVVNMLKSCIM